jgi:hypothetical protein
MTKEQATYWVVMEKDKVQGLLLHRLKKHAKINCFGNGKILKVKLVIVK